MERRAGQPGVGGASGKEISRELAEAAFKSGPPVTDRARRTLWPAGSGAARGLLGARRAPQA